MKEIEKKILSCITAARAEHGESPSISEIAEAVGYQSRGSVHRYVKSLIEQGYLVNRGGRRGLMASGKPIPSDSLPLLGRIAAGRPIEAINDHSEINVSEMFAGDHRYVLQVTGMSMVDAGIHDGDYVVVRRTGLARRNDIVVALIDHDEVTLKYYDPKPNGEVHLRPANSTMSTMIYEAGRVIIQGVIVGQMRTY